MKIPHLLLLFRFLAAPVVLLLSYFMGESSKFIVLTLMYLGLISDILDGIIARKLDIATEKLRRLDSQVDIIFWLAIGVSTWLLFPDVIEKNLIPISILLFAEGLCYLVSIVKFGRETCTHAYLSKLWGITLLVGFTSLIGFGYAGIPFIVAVTVGLISHLDVILIILLLPEWGHDIPSSYHAYLIRKGKQIKRNKYFHG